MSAAIDEGELNLNQRFSSLDEAAQHLSPVLGPISDEYNVELGAWFTGSSTEVLIDRIHVGTRTTVSALHTSNRPGNAVGEWHIHPRGLSHLFSVDDVKWVNDTGLPLYMTHRSQLRVCSPGDARCNFRIVSDFVRRETPLAIPDRALAGRPVP